MARTHVEIRDDLSTKLVHLTKGPWAEAQKSLLGILSAEAIIGSIEGIRSREKCVCFTETPISKLSLVLASRNETGFRYAPFGILTSKKSVYAAGGLPVIYQPPKDFDLLNPAKQYLHQSFAGNLDFTWEREWRTKADSFPVDPSEVTVIVPNRAVEREILDQGYSKVQRMSIGMHIGIPKSVIENKWHFITLEDLGVEFQKE